MKRVAIGVSVAVSALIGSILVVSGSSADAAGDGPDPGTTAERTSSVSQPAARVSVTLPTGDRVVLRSADGSQYSIVRGPGREHVTFQTSYFDDHLVVVPTDVARLVTSGKVDRQLFDVTALVDAGYDDTHADQLPLIVSFRTSADRERMAGTPGIRLTRELPVIDGAAVRIDTDRGSSFARIAGSDAIERIWLDRRLRPVLDESVPQIGAPEAWAAGYTGEGVTVARRTRMPVDMPASRSPARPVRRCTGTVS